MTNKVVCCGETNFRCDSRINHVDAANSHTVSNVKPWRATRSTSTEEERGSDPLSTIRSTKIRNLTTSALTTITPCFVFQFHLDNGIYNPIGIVLFLSRNVFASTGQETNRNDMKRNDMKWHCFVGFACLAYLVLS